MKKKTFNKLIQKPLRFHHQDIHEELDCIKEMLNHVNSTMQRLQQRIDELTENTSLRLPEYDASKERQDHCTGSCESCSCPE